MALMECPACKELISDKARTCIKCELPLAVACTDCGSDIQYPATQCPGCGCPLKEIVNAVEAANVSTIASIMYKAELTERVEKMEAELLKPLFGGIYVSKVVESAKHAFGMFKHGYSRDFLQFFEDGTAFFQPAIVLKTEMPSEESLKSIIGIFSDAFRDWEMDGKYIVIKDRVGRATNARVSDPGMIVVGTGKQTSSDATYIFVQTDHKLRSV